MQRLLGLMLVAGWLMTPWLEAYPMVLGPDGRPRAELFPADRLHFNAAGYKLLVGRVRACLPN